MSNGNHVGSSMLEHGDVVSPEMVHRSVGISSTDSIKVAVRVRPLNSKEVTANVSEGVTVAEDATHVELAGADGKRQSLHFHCCLGPSATQEDVLHRCGATQLMDAALFGYHATVMAYGQTSAGKTYTMFGPEDVLAKTGDLGGVHEGITFRCVRHLFKTAATDASERVVVKTSCLEVYNEGIYDLLNITNKQLALKWETDGGFLAQGLKVIECTSFEKFVHVAHTGMKNRRTGAHALNHESSRSHAILSVTVETLSTSEEGAPLRRGKVSFVDLAGSERVKDTGAAGGTLKEANSINKSLFTLGKVISALSEPGAQAGGHVPYRDSKLTKLLMNSIGGSSLCLMVACVTPSCNHREETLNTLQYATRAKRIVNRPLVQQDHRQSQVSLLKQENEVLRDENEYLRSIVYTQYQELQIARTPSAGQAQATNSGADTAASTASTPHQQTEQGQFARQATSATEQARGNSGANSLPPIEYVQRENHTSRVPYRSSGDPSQPRFGSLGSVSSWGRTSSLAYPHSRLGSLENDGTRSPASPKLSVDGDTGRRLQQTQALLAQFSAANSRLAEENDKLRTVGPELARDPADVLHEIQCLRGRLTVLEGAAAQLERSTPGMQQTIHPATGLSPVAQGTLAGAGELVVDLTTGSKKVGVGALPAAADGPGHVRSGSRPLRTYAAMHSSSRGASSSPSSRHGGIRTSSTAPGDGLKVNPAKLGLLLDDDLEQCLKPSAAELQQAGTSTT